MANEPCAQRAGCHDYRHGTDCPRFDWDAVLAAGHPGAYTPYRVRRLPRVTINRADLETHQPHAIDLARAELERAGRAEMAAWDEAVNAWIRRSYNAHLLTLERAAATALARVPWALHHYAPLIRARLKQQAAAEDEARRG